MGFILELIRDKQVELDFGSSTGDLDAAAGAAFVLCVRCESYRGNLVGRHHEASLNCLGREVVLDNKFLESRDIRMAAVAERCVAYHK